MSIWINLVNSKLASSSCWQPASDKARWVLWSTKSKVRSTCVHEVLDSKDCKVGTEIKRYLLQIEEKYEAFVTIGKITINLKDNRKCCGVCGGGWRVWTPRQWKTSRVLPLALKTTTLSTMCCQQRYWKEYSGWFQMLKSYKTLKSERIRKDFYVPGFFLLKTWKWQWQCAGQIGKVFWNCAMEVVNTIMPLF